MSNSNQTLWSSVSARLQKNGIRLQNSSVLVGLSGGLDSIVLAHLLHTNGVRIELAHVNYQLRGQESLEDEIFVKAFAASHGIRLHLFHPQQDADQANKKSGVQNWARNLRYDWFNQLREECKLDWIAVAHHMGDQAETIIHQFVRGGMLPALRGMKLQRDGIIRPLLHSQRHELMDYARVYNLSWREDSSNSKSDYTRNKIRHQLIPLLQELNPGVIASISERSVLFGEMESLVNTALDREVNQIFQIKGDTWSALSDVLLSSKFTSLIVWHVLQPRGFTPHQSEEVVKMMENGTHAAIHSDTHSLSFGRGLVTIQPRSEAQSVFIQIPSPEFSIGQPLTIYASIISNQQVIFSGNEYEAHLSLTKLSFPLIVRTWHEGDKFQPLGMSGHQKISDLLIQNKIPIKDKQNICVLESGGQIAWVIGLRISEAFKVSPSDREVWKVTVTGHPKP